MSVSRVVLTICTGESVSYVGAEDTEGAKETDGVPEGIEEGAEEGAAVVVGKIVVGGGVGGRVLEGGLILGLGGKEGELDGTDGLGPVSHSNVVSTVAKYRV